jgi:hypothetical protein
MKISEENDKKKNPINNARAKTSNGSTMGKFS